MTNEYTPSTPKVALVTGGSRGIGRNTCLLYTSSSSDIGPDAASVRLHSLNGTK